jgi:hypothetical protein
MKRATAVLSRVALVLVTATLAAQTPNFTGKWVIDADKSPAPAGGGFVGGPLTITQDAKTFKAERVIADNTFTQIYNLDGSPSKNTMNMGGNVVEQESTARWDGSTLVITTKGPNGDTVVKHSMDGADLKVEITRPGRQGGPPATTVTYYKKG